MKKIRPTVAQFIVIISIILLLTVSLSLNFEIKKIKSQYEQLALDTAKSYFNTILALRKWNAIHNGVYVSVDEKTQPNPYLGGPYRDVETVEGLRLTKINPAFMTRLVSEIMNDSINVRYHITSLKPINPQNTPDQWEAESLKDFEKGAPSSYTIRASGKGSLFCYMEPVKVDQSCLQCHVEQGYKIGDIRGGISVFLPYGPYEKAQNSNILASVKLHLIFLGLIGIIIFIFGKKSIATEKKLEYLAHTDELTGLLNRRYLIEHLNDEIDRGLRYRHPLSVIILDLDRFKEVNDQYGHIIGDKVLKEVAGLISGNIRSVDIAGRYGGDEFVIILPETALEGAKETGRRMLNALQQAILYKGEDFSIRLTLSMGIAELDENKCGSNPADWLLSKADEAMYRAKGAGGNLIY
ncbi:MAG: diguanylate cyclase [Bacillota bacterium]